MPQATNTQAPPLYQSIASLLPQSNGSIPTLTDDEWNNLKVNTKRIQNDATDRQAVADQIGSLAPMYIQVLHDWLGLSVTARLTRDEVQEEIAAYISSNNQDTKCLTILYIVEYTRRKRERAVLEVAQDTLSQSNFQLVTTSGLSDTAKRDLLILLTFCANKRRLKTLMLYNRAERSGFVRHSLQADPDLDTQQTQADYQAAKNDISTANTSNTLTLSAVDQALQVFESNARQGRQSRCFDVFENVGSTSGRLVFILRGSGEQAIRQLNDVIFTDRADFFMVRLEDDLRMIDTHPRIRWDKDLATTLAREIIGNDDIEYVPEQQVTAAADLEKMIRELRAGNDPDMELYEVDLENAPIVSAPRLIIRADDNSGLLADALSDLDSKGVSLTDNLDAMRVLGVAFESSIRQGEAYKFRFKVFPDGNGDYYLPYSDSVKASKVCRQFERHLASTYNVYVYPGDTRKP
jgi:hypothetical protein